MSIELRHLRYFIAVAEELNITKAAERLHTVQPSLGRQIHQLEEFVGVPLLLREGHRLELTEAGRIMLGESRRMLHELELIIEQLQREANMTAGRITVGFLPRRRAAGVSTVASIPPVQLSRHRTCPTQFEGLGTIGRAAEPHDRCRVPPRAD